MFDIGSQAGDATPSIQPCSDSLKNFDSTKTGNNLIAAHVTAYMPHGGKVFFSFGTDSNSVTKDSITVDSLLSPYVYTDTATGLNASTRYWIAFSDSCGNSTGFKGFYTQDSTVTIAEWLNGNIKHLDTESTGAFKPAFKPAFLAAFKKAFK